MSGFGHSFSHSPYQHGQRTLGSGSLRPTGLQLAGTLPYSPNGPSMASTQDLEVTFPLDPSLGVAETAYRPLASNSGLMGGQVDYMRRCMELEQEARVCNAQYMVLRDAYIALIQAVPQLLQFVTPPPGLPIPTTGFAAPVSGVSPTLALPQLLQKDYPNVRYWRQTEYQKRDKEDTTLRQKEDSKKTTMYLEDDTGTQISKSLRSRLYNHAFAFWKALEDSGIKVTNFRDTNLDIIKRFRTSVEADFWFLRLCEHHWKADELWKQTCSTYLKKPASRDSKMDIKTERLLTEVVATAAVKEDSPELTLEYMDEPIEISDNELEPPAKRASPNTGPKGPSPKRPRLSAETPSAPTPSAGRMDDTSSTSKGKERAPLKLINPLARLRMSTATKTTDEPSIIPPTSSTTKTPSSISQPSPERVHAPIATDSIAIADLADLAPVAPPGTEPLAPVVASTSRAADQASMATRSAPKRQPASAQLFVPNKTSNTAKSICGREWNASHPNGTKGEFEGYYKALTEVERQRYRLQEKELKKSNKENMNSAAKINVTAMKGSTAAPDANDSVVMASTTSE
ncbi:hypothetical protein PC9H_010372 [Pleurotus ostreatus]|uniref:Uncharacterized protein n=1 Tax=Pleurotus ostreatus TaxID=5322 RepID=A0A8H7DLX5_PLEOS|nr:uncharacterized protein PC9H_010372 [Pleurotus ostreatus]KAF7422216.1 hypothetical protein PC9H_010372 [Pleurotus ostreatus]